MSRSDYYASPFGVTFSFYMERPRLGRLIARAFWGSDVRPYYESMAAIAQVPQGGRSRQVELAEADATQIPLPDDSADLFLSYWGLHCFDDPAAALREAARVLDPGGRIVGSTFVLGRNSRRGRLLIKPGRGDFGNPGTAEDVVRWLADAGFAAPETRTSGSMLFFDARLG